MTIVSDDVAAAHAFLAGLRNRGQSGQAVFGSIAVGRMSVKGPNLNTTPKFATGPLDGDDLLKLMR